MSEKRYNKKQLVLIAVGIAIGLSCVLMRTFKIITATSGMVLPFMVFERSAYVFAGTGFVMGKKIIDRLTGIVLLVLGAGWIVFLLAMQKLIESP